MALAALLAPSLPFASTASPQDGGWSPPPPPAIVPSPRFAEPRFAAFVLPDDVRVVAAEPELAALAPVLARLIEQRTGRAPTIGVLPAGANDFILTTGYLNEAIADEPEAFGIEVFSDHVAITGSSEAGVARGVARLVQLFSYDDENDAWTLPPVRIEDAPQYAWRGLMLDLARFPHSADSVIEAIDLAYLFSLNVVHLHLSDDQSFTFPTQLLPVRTDAEKPGADRGYTPDEIARIVRHARLRSITLVPEIDVPAHSSALTRARPDLFGTQDAETGEWRSLGMINIVSPAAFEATEGLLTEVAEAFPHSPYVHLGGDEVWGRNLLELPEFASFTQARGLPATLEDGAINALLNHFLQHMADHVRSLGRKPIVWEGFRPTGDVETTLLNDVLVMSWNQHTQTPEALLAAGYSIVNCGWDPLYVVPAQGWAASPESAYAWTPHEVRQRFGGRVAKLGESAAVLGAQICVWEQRPDAIVPSLLDILPAIAERSWGSHAASAERADFPAAAARATIEALLRPVRVTPSSTKAGRLLGSGTAFTGTIEVRLVLPPHRSGTVRYELSGAYGTPVLASSKAYDGSPLRIDASTVVSAALYDDTGRRSGGTTAVRFEQAEALFEAEAYLGSGEADRQRWIGSALLVRPTEARIADINRELFARVNPKAHVDTRPIAWTDFGEAARVDRSRPRLWGQHRVHATGQIDIPEDGEWTLTIRSNDGETRVWIGDAEAGFSAGGQRTTRSGWLAAGTFGLRFEHVVTGVHDELQAWLDGPGGRSEVPLTDFVRPLDDRLPREELTPLAGFQPR